MKKPSFSIIIGTYKQAHVLEKVLKGWADQDYKGRYEVFVCDDASPDNTEEVVTNFTKTVKTKIKLLRFPVRDEKLGCLSRNLNQALPHLTAQYTFYCMGDTIPMKNTLSELAKHVGPKKVLCAMRMNVDEDLNFQSLDWRYEGNDGLQALNIVPIGDKFPWSAITGNGLLIPTKDLKEIGGWCEEFVGWGEDDYEVALRLYEKGLSFFHVPQVRIMHITHPVTLPNKGSELLWEKKYEEYKERRRKAITSITLDFDDFSPNNNGMFYLKKLKEHFPLMKVSLFTVPFKMVDSTHVENWTICKNLVDEINACDWIEILPHGFFHYMGEFEGLTYQQTKVAIAATEELFTKLGFNWKRIFRAPHWMFGEEALRAYRDCGYIVATNPDADLKVPRGLKEYQHNCGVSMVLPNFDELRLHGHIQNWNNTGLEQNFKTLLELPTDKPWKFLSEHCMETKDNPNVNTSDYWNEIFKSGERPDRTPAGSKTVDNIKTEEIIYSIPATAKVLDIGCGDGYIGNALQEKGCFVTGVDFSDKAIEGANKRSKGAKFLVKDILKDSFDDLDNDFDYVISTEVWEHLSDPSVLIKLAFPRLKNGGKILFTCPNGSRIKSVEHIREYTAESVEKIFKSYAGISNLEIEKKVSNMYLFIKGVKNG